LFSTKIGEVHEGEQIYRRADLFALSNHLDL